MNIRIDLAEHTPAFFAGLVFTTYVATEIGRWLERRKAARLAAESSEEEEAEDEDEEEPASHPYRTPAEVEAATLFVKPRATCVGYYHESEKEMRADCDGLRFEGCSVGRCRYHCRSMCECEDA